ncbi:MAG: ABC transporter ATP-binding protein, partial [Candidatus Heimdallarchaeaceae archaeon]
ISIILTTHLMEVADRLCDRIKIIDYGKVIAEGSPSDLKIRYGGNDVIEIIFDDSIPSSKFNSFLSQLKERFSKVVVSDFLVKIFTRNGASLIPSVVDFATKDGVMSFITNLHLRGSTLEDVFISLTGRQLRD